MSAPAPPDLAWSAQHTPLAITLATTTGAVLLAHYGVSAERLSARFAAKGLDPDRAHARGVWLGRLLRTLAHALAAVVALVFLPDLRAALFALPTGASLAWALGAYALLAPILFLAAGKPAHQARYPELRRERYTRRDLALEATTWSLYLLAYEAVFRGTLLYGLLAWGGPWPALLIATSLYVLAHLPKDAGETLGCVVMGLGFGALAFQGGGVLAPWLLHVLVALSASAFALLRRPPSERPEAAGTEKATGNQERPGPR